MMKFSWDMGYYCNFRCHYCFFTEAGWTHMERAQGDPKTPREMEGAWKDIFQKFGSCLVYITGGEPFLYPYFTDIINRMTQYHALHITSNLSRPLDDFLRELDPRRVTLNATFHPLYIDARTFLDQVLRLRNSGFRCDACYLAHPLQLREMSFYARLFLREGVHLTITEFWGNCGGKEYPHGYSEQEREHLRDVQRGENESSGGGARKREEGIAGQRRSSIGSAPALSRGNLCRAGTTYAVITVDGNVKPCGQVAGPFLGNIYSRNVSLREQPLVCTANFCRSGEAEYFRVPAAVTGEIKE